MNPEHKKDGTFAPKGTGVAPGGDKLKKDKDLVTGEEKYSSDLSKSIDDFDLSDVSLDDVDMSFFDLSDVSLDDVDMSFFDEVSTPQVSLTLENYETNRKNKIVESVADEFKKVSDKIAKAYSDKMSEILQETEIISRFQVWHFLSIIESGTYMNQFQAGHSEGSMYHAETISQVMSTGRGRMSKRTFGTDFSKMKTIEDAYKLEKYGTLASKDMNDIFDLKDNADNYGYCFIHYKQDRVRENTTFTMGDSLGGVGMGGLLAQKMNEVPDIYHARRGSFNYVTKNQIEECKNIYDMRKTLGVCYPESQIHIDNIDIGQHVDYIGIDYQYLNGQKFYTEHSDWKKVAKDIVNAIKKSKTKYPSLLFKTRLPSGKLANVEVGSEGNLKFI